MKPSSVSYKLRCIAIALEKATRPSKTGAVNLLVKLASGIEEVSSPVKLKLLSSKASENELDGDTTYLQEWEFILSDGTKINTTTNVGWGDEPTDVPHGNTELNICGHELTVEQILGYIISTCIGPSKDGESISLDGEWCSRMYEVGHIQASYNSSNLSDMGQEESREELASMGSSFAYEAIDQADNYGGLSEAIASYADNLMDTVQEKGGTNDDADYAYQVFSKTIREIGVDSNLI